ncbi:MULTISPECIES: bifunctional GNAT family N-acetyltransferase/carbon-nitrogen hydrolase family protein [Zunongwangia]|jgi:predicted amidohydrolase/GNAT superfamily N-acetyltransferase|uniref:Carbon-nitrogen hydrolase n=2 Tax=Zunongwangia profunda TaxID=398743 RepID=D5BG11_ZUNPS|nr:bifunctional GNAT family N-acetyltransferase/carbon-nitrogen hydrolase family protein [Zunongwangia profunda]ADF53124.1 carbon-nitrogen hydrolase [Zunongwangia profunda SM-A87]MAC64435.1 carbon-nitrogen hydrolase [Flavobacteriaceae bacterium]MCC4227794.1 bifunctional GNAT family N-acetyltransferase/carbon-nitrogen hydrolase family protein [Zunongwangia profunda]HCV81525.1 GNAT family N-acetyltransferase [Zunongwangia profunda]|tara:strand:+ start:250 stop:1770 length:1521 start_codon:yes stop_codon:yes gene_type:complete
METPTIELRNLKVQDYKELKVSMIKSYSGMPDDYWSAAEIKTLVKKFPDGQFCIVIDNKIAGCALSIIVDYDKFDDNHTYDDIIGGENFSTHTKNGDVLYGIDVFIHPEYRGKRLGRRLYEARKELCEQLNLKSIIFGGRIPNFAKYANELTPKKYIDKVKLQEIHDPVLSFQLSNDFHVKKVIKGYLSGDHESKEYAVLMEWNNIYYTKPQKLIESTKTVVRLGLVQWQMRLFKNFDALVSQIEFFVDAVSDYQSDFILFPELFNAPLMAEFNHLNEAEAIRGLSTYTDKLLETFIDFAINYNINIITGSMPQVIGEHMYNVGFLCRRDGSYERYEKLHITPAEESAWGMKGGTKLQTFDTDCGKIGVLICYDVEFPELPRLLAEEGMNILFVPFMTDTQNGYSRVRICAQSRAVENECYVAIAGSVGNLPKVNNMDIQYSQSAVLTPSDFAFPVNGVKAEATPNTESTLLADVDLDLLKELHNFGSVRNLKDRRKDLYSIKLKK